MDLKNWEKKIAVKKVKRVLENYGFKTKSNIQVEVHGDLIGSWKRNQKDYMFYITARFNKQESDSLHFQNSLEFCKNNKIKMIVVCWAHESRIFEGALDSRVFKIVEYERMNTLNQEWELLN